MFVQHSFSIQHVQILTPQFCFINFLSFLFLISTFLSYKYTAIIAKSDVDFCCCCSYNFQIVQLVSIVVVKNPERSPPLSPVMIVNWVLKVFIVVAGYLNTNRSPIDPSHATSGPVIPKHNRCFDLCRFSARNVFISGNLATVVSDTATQVSA